MQRKRIHFFLLISLLIAGLPFVLLPLLSTFTRWNFPNLIPQEWGTDNWSFFFRGQGDIRYSAFITILIAVTTAVIATSVGFFLSRNMIYQKWSSWGVFFSFLPVTISPVLFATILAYYFNVGNLSGSILGVILAQLLIAIPFAIIYFTAFWGSRIRQLEQLSATLGANATTTFRQVVFPIARPFIFVCFFQTFIISWFEYGMTSVIGSGQIQTLTIKVFYYVREASPFMAALSATLLIFPPAILLWFNRQFVFKQVSL